MAISLSTDYIVEKYNSIKQQVDQCWNRTGAWQDYLNAMRQTLPVQSDLSNQNRIVLRFAMLPGLCCEAAGGQFRWADPVAAAWLLFYNSAHIFDNIEDKDQLDPCWSAANSGVAINAASGLIFSAYLCLQELNNAGVSPGIYNCIVEDFSNTLLVMSGGQHQDLTDSIQGLEGWYRVAEMKSGAFFALACRAGAQLATEDQELIHYFNEFGYQVGILLQMLDDVGDFIDLQQGENSVLPEALTRSLVVAYCLEVSPEEIKLKLRDLLASGKIASTTSQEFIDLLSRCGAGLYLATEIEKRRVYALTALASAGPKNDARENLNLILADLMDSVPTAFLLK